MNLKFDTSAQPPMFFILGRGRSGTWLLQAILEQHPQLSPAPEALFLISLKNKYGQKTNWTKPELLSFCRDLWEEKRLATWWQLQWEELEEVVIQFEGQFSYARICQAVYQLNALKKGKQETCLMGDKNPSYALFITEILELYPRAKFVCMVRDFRDNILSYQKATFDLNGTAALAQRWVGYNEQILQFAGQLPQQFLMERYEDFLAEPEKVLTRVCQFLGVKFEPGMLQFHQKERKLEAWQHNLDKPLDPSRVYAWKEKMHPRHVAIAEAICGSLASNWSYEVSLPQGTSLSLSSRLGMFGGQLFNLLERQFFNIPFSIRTPILNFYRKITKTV